MDRVRLGRALGYGARHAVKTFAEVAKAASAAEPAQAEKARVHPQPAAREPSSRTTPTQGGEIKAAACAPRGQTSPVRDAAAQIMEAQQAVSQAKSQVRAGAVGAGRSMLAPVRRAGGVLWLEMTGCAFALFALFLAPGLWKLRSAIHASPGSPEAQKFYLYLLVLVLFTYFAVTSFVRASRRGKRP